MGDLGPAVVCGVLVRFKGIGVCKGSFVSQQFFAGSRGLPGFVRVAGGSG